MGADNWGTCPQCKVNADKASGVAVREAAAAYGKVPPEEYAAMVEAIKHPKPIGETLSEYYEIHTKATGEFYIDYGCGCDVCGFRHTYNFKEQLKIKT